MSACLIFYVGMPTELSKKRSPQANGSHITSASVRSFGCCMCTKYPLGWLNRGFSFKATSYGIAAASQPPSFPNQSPRQLTAADDFTQEQPYVRNLHRIYQAVRLLYVYIIFPGAVLLPPSIHFNSLPSIRTSATTPLYHISVPYSPPTDQVNRRR